MKNKGRGKLLALLYLVVHFPRIGYAVVSAVEDVVNRVVDKANNMPVHS